MKYYKVVDKIFTARCDAHEYSHMLALKIYKSDQNNVANYKLLKYDDHSWAVYDKATREWIYVALVEITDE